MDAKFTEVVIKEAVPSKLIPGSPAVVERRVVLELSEEEARILRAVSGKLQAGVDANNTAFGQRLRFLYKLDRLFPDDHKLSNCCGISTYRIVKGDF